MATNILNISSSNTWGDLIRAVNNSVNALNELGFGDYTKDTGTLTVPDLIVSNTANIKSTTVTANVNITDKLIVSDSGKIVIGTDSTANSHLILNKPIATTNSSGILIQSTLRLPLTDFTSIKSNIQVANSAITIPTLKHFYANTAKLGTLPSIANNYGFYIGPEFAAGTNNYGFYSNIPSSNTTSNWNLYLEGTANNYIKGNLGINTTTPTANLHIVGTEYVEASGTSSAVKISQAGTGNALYFENVVSGSVPLVITANGTFVVGDNKPTNYNVPFNANSTNYETRTQFASGGLTLAYYATGTQNYQAPLISFNRSANNTITGHAIVSNTHVLGAIGFSGSDGSKFLMGAGIRAEVDGTPTTSSMPGKLIFSTTPNGANTSVDRMIIDANGNVGIATTPQSGRGFDIKTDIYGASTSYGLIVDGEIQPNVTDVRIVSSEPDIYNSSFTVPYLYHFTATQGTYGASSNVTNQYAYYVSSNLTKANNNYGFYSNLSEAANTWSFYGAGNAASYFAGDIRFDNTIAAVSGNTTINKNAGRVTIASPLSSLVVTNNRVTKNSIILLTVASLDSKANTAKAVANSGFFNIYTNAAPASSVNINFVVLN